MRFRVVVSQFLGGLCGCAAYVALAVPTAQAQGPIYSGPCADCSQPTPAPGPWIPNQPLMPRAETTTPTRPTETPTNPGPTAPNPGENNAVQNEANTNQDNSNFNFSGSQGLASGAGSFSSPGGYLDDAIPQTVFKLRYDAEDGINRFDRADYMFGTWREGSFHTHALVGNGGIRGTFFDTKATGSQTISNDLRDQILSADLEYALDQRLSVFAEVPYQFVHFGPDLEDAVEPQGQTRAAILNREQFPENESRNAKTDPIGAGDVQAGFKYAFVADSDFRYLTFQFRTYIPTGDPGLGLGTGHVSLEPGLLAFQRLTDRTVIQGEFTDWIPINAGQGAGNVITYGGGIAYDVIQRPNFRVAPVAEVVGWTCLGGTEGIVEPIPGPVTQPPGNGGQPLVPAVNVNGTFVPDNHGFLEANGDTIVNLKFGVRTYVGERSDLYLGYGRSVTGSRWYQDIASVEYRLHF